MAEPDVKSGWTSSEFWLAVGAGLAGSVVALAPLFHRTPEEATTIATAIRDAAAHIGGLVVLAVAAWNYVKGRSAVKVSANEAKVVAGLAAKPLSIIDARD